MRRAAKGLAALGIEVDLILSSPYVRAQATAEIVTKVLPARHKIQLTDHLTPDGDAAALIRQVARTAKKRVLLVGHEPYLSNLIGRLIGGGVGLSLKLRKGSVCKLAAERLKFARCAELEFLLTSGQLARIR